MNDMSQFQFAISHYKDLLDKLTYSLSVTWKTLFVFFYPSDLLILSAAFILPVSKDDKIKSFRKFILWIIILQTILLLPSGGSPARFYLYLFPAIIIFLGMAWGISWYADRKSVWLPYDIETMDKISKNIPIDYVFLTQDLAGPPASYKDNIWQRLFFEVGSFNIHKFKLVNVFYYNKNKIGVLYKVIH